MRSDGFEPLIIEEDKGLKLGKSLIKIIPHNTGSINDIDSALSIQYEGNNKMHTVLNVNDIIMNEPFIGKLNNLFPMMIIFL